MKLEEAKLLCPGDELYACLYRNADGSPQRWRVSGRVKTWAKDPSRVSFPVKRGLYDNDRADEGSLHLLHLSEEEACRAPCPPCGPKFRPGARMTVAGRSALPRGTRVRYIHDYAAMHGKCGTVVAGDHCGFAEVKWDHDGSRSSYASSALRADRGCGRAPTELTPKSRRKQRSLLGGTRHPRVTTFGKIPIGKCFKRIYWLDHPVDVFIGRRTQWGYEMYHPWGVTERDQRVLSDPVFRWPCPPRRQRPLLGRPQRR